MTTRKYPAPLYAAAGAGDYAYRQLRKLPAKLTDLPTRVSELRGRVAASELDIRADLHRFRRVARRNAQAALGEARTAYAGLVARGERVVDRAPTDVAVRRPADVAAVATADGAAQTKPVKRTRAATRK